MARSPHHEKAGQPLKVNFQELQTMVPVSYDAVKKMIGDRVKVKDGDGSDSKYICSII